MPHTPTPTDTVQIRAYRFAAGLLHLLRDGAMSDAEVVEYYYDKGALVEATDGEMNADTFF